MVLPALIGKMLLLVVVIVMLMKPVNWGVNSVMILTYIVVMLMITDCVIIVKLIFVII